MSAGMKEVHIRSVITSIVQSSRKTSSWFPTMFHLESVHGGRKKLGATSPKQCAAPCFGGRLHSCLSSSLLIWCLCVSTKVTPAGSVTISAYIFRQ